jgi:hypothetical protein
VSGRPKAEELSEYEKDYLKRLATKGKIKSMQREELLISEEERTRKVEEAEKVQIESAMQVQRASAAKIQAESDLKDKQKFLNKEVMSLIEELRLLRIQIDKGSVKRKVTKKKVSPKRKTTVKRKVTKKKVSPKRKTTVKRKVTKKTSKKSKIKKTKKNRRK